MDTTWQRMPSWALTPERSAQWCTVARAYTEVRILRLLERIERSQADADYWTTARPDESVVTAATSLYHLGVRALAYAEHIALDLTGRPDGMCATEIDRLIAAQLATDHMSCGVGDQDHPELVLWPRHERFCVAPTVLFEYLFETQNERFFLGGYEQYALGTIAAEVGDDLDVLTVAWQLHHGAADDTSFEQPELAIVAAAAIIHPT